MGRLTEIITANGRPWTDYYPDIAAGVGEGWYKSY